MGFNHEGDIRLLRKLNSNVSKRGIRDLETYGRDFINLKIRSHDEFRHETDLPGKPVIYPRTYVATNASGKLCRLKYYPIATKTWPTFIRWLDMNGYDISDPRRVLRQAELLGYLDSTTFEDRITRPNLFQELLTKGSDRKSIFNTEPLVKTYKIIRRKIIKSLPDFYEVNFDQSDKEIYQIIMGVNNILFYPINCRLLFERARGANVTEISFQDTLINGFTRFQPSLNLGLKFVNMTR